MYITLVRELINAFPYRYTADDMFYFYNMGFISKGAYESLVCRTKDASGRFKERLIMLPSGVELILDYIPAGSFMMGSPPNELGRKDDEVLHKVHLTEDFELGKYPITQRQWKTLMPDNPSHFQGDDLPVERVGRQQALEFCELLTQYQYTVGGIPKNLRFTLPTEAQWEYAARAGDISQSALYSGKPVTTKGLGACGNVNELAWYCMNSKSRTHPVGRKLPNSFGLCDLYGNVWEWCLDFYGAYPMESVIDPLESRLNIKLVCRGGGWKDHAKTCRSAFRGQVSPRTCASDLGFRVALTSRKYVQDFLGK